MYHNSQPTDLHIPIAYSYSIMYYIVQMHYMHILTYDIYEYLYLYRSTHIHIKLRLCKYIDTKASMHILSFTTTPRCTNKYASIFAYTKPIFIQIICMYTHICTCRYLICIYTNIIIQPSYSE